jgi:hypothetical protein
VILTLEPLTVPGRSAFAGLDREKTVVSKHIMLRQVYFAITYVQSHILFSLLIWGSSPYLSELFCAQIRVVRAMAGRSYQNKGPIVPVESCRPLFKEYDILPVFSLYVMRKVCKKKNRKNLSKKVVCTRENYTYSTSNCQID